MASVEQIEVDGATEPTEEAARESILAASDGPPRRRLSRALVALGFIGAGVNHFVNPRFYEPMVPPPLQKQAGPVVAISGVAEIAGGLGVLLPWTRRLSGKSLVVLLAAVFPANVYMATDPERFKKIPRWGLFARLPLQPLMMLWVLRATRR
jgi:uncharacterized membrane protein